MFSWILHMEFVRPVLVDEKCHSRGKTPILGNSWIKKVLNFYHNFKIDCTYSFYYSVRYIAIQYVLITCIVLEISWILKKKFFFNEISNCLKRNPRYLENYKSYRNVPYGHQMQKLSDLDCGTAFLTVHLLFVRLLWSLDPPRNYIPHIFLSYSGNFKPNILISRAGTTIVFAPFVYSLVITI